MNKRMSLDIQQNVADGAAALSAGTVAATYSGLLNDAALVVAIISGLVAIAWHIHLFRQDRKNRRGKKE